MKEYALYLNMFKRFTIDYQPKPGRSNALNNQIYVYLPELDTPSCKGVDIHALKE